MRYRGRGVVMGASLSALVLVASGCTGAEEAEPTPSFASSTADAEPNPELTEPPYETELNLTPDEKKAADEAYAILVKFINAYNRVGADSGSNPERALKYASGDVESEYRSSFRDFEQDGLRVVGGVTHKYHEVSDVSIQGSEPGEGNVEFQSCVDFSAFDLVDEAGQSQAGEDTRPFIVVYTVSKEDGGWKFSELRNTDETC